jgi:hypothetical protein
MYCLFQLYVCVAGELAPHRPVLKLFAVKAVGGFLPIYAYRMVLMPTLPDSISDFLASHFSISTKCDRGRQRRMALCFRWKRLTLLITNVS